MFAYEDKKYLDSDPVDYTIAIKIGGDYYQEAMKKGLPNPPACLVFAKLANPLDVKGSSAGFYAMMQWIIQKNERYSELQVAAV